MVDQLKKLLLPSIIFAAFFRLQIGIFKFALAQEELTVIVIAKEVGVSLLMVLTIGFVIALVFSLLISLLNWIPFSRGFRPPRPLLISAILISASLPLFFIGPAVLGFTGMSDNRSESYGLAIMAVSIASFIVWFLVLVMGIVKRDKDQPQPDNLQAPGVMHSPVMLTGFVLLLCISIGTTLISPPHLPQTAQESADAMQVPQGYDERMQIPEQQALVKQTMEKSGYLQDIEGNWIKVRSESKFMQLVVEIDGLRLKAMGLDFIEVKNKIDKDGSEILKAVMAGTKGSDVADTLTQAVGELRLLKHPKGDIFLRDIAMVSATLSDKEPPKDASPFLVRLMSR